MKSYIFACTKFNVYFWEKSLHTVKKCGVISDTMADSFHFVFVPLYTLYCRKYKKLLRQEKSTEKKNKYRKGEKHEVCSILWIHYAIEKPWCGNISLWLFSVSSVLNTQKKIDDETEIRAIFHTSFLYKWCLLWKH